VPQRPRLVLSKDDHLPRTFGEPFEHRNGDYWRNDARLGQCSGMTPERVVTLLGTPRPAADG
jgi:hypothetical protein